MMVKLFLTLLDVVVVVATLASTGHAKVVDNDFPQISYVQFDSLNLTAFPPFDPVPIAGELRVPVRDSPVAAVVILHGSAGIDSRGKLYKEALNKAGIATLEVDMFTPRGLSGFQRPQFPTVNVPDAFAALAYLQADIRIKPDRIGLLGFSWGGVVTMLAASRSFVNFYTTIFKTSPAGFASHVAHYPVCYGYNTVLPPPLPAPTAPGGLEFGNLSTPVLIQIGEFDDYDNGGEPCQDLIDSLPQGDQDLLSLNIYVNAYHAWDRLQPEISFFDPFANLGLSGNVTIAPSPGKAFQSKRTVTGFFDQTLVLED